MDHSRYKRTRLGFVFKVHRNWGGNLSRAWVKTKYLLEKKKKERKVIIMLNVGFHSRSFRLVISSPCIKKFSTKHTKEGLYVNVGKFLQLQNELVIQFFFYVRGTGRGRTS